VKRGGDATMTSPSFDTVKNQTNDFRDWGDFFQGRIELPSGEALPEDYGKECCV